MPKHLQLSSPHGPIVIELLDNPFVNLWSEHHEMMTQQYQTQISIAVPGSIKRYNSTEINHVIDNIIAAVDQLNSATDQSIFSTTVTKPQLLACDLSTQKILNQLHHRAVTCLESDIQWREFDYLLNLVNQRIHALESYVTTPHKQQCEQSAAMAQFEFDLSKYQDVVVLDQGTFQTITEQDQQHLQMWGHDVWIKKDLLGKDFVQAYLDHDDPAQSDIHPQVVFTGGVCVDINNWRENFFKNPSFAAWLGKTPSDYHGSYPLGNVVSGKEYLQKIKRSVGAPAGN